MKAIADLKTALWSTAFLFGAWQRNSALKALCLDSGADAVETLADAVNRKHPLADRMARHLAQLSPQTHQASIDRLWALWASHRHASLEAILTEAGHPAQNPQLRLLSLLKLGKRDAAITESVLDRVGRLLPFFRDADRHVQAGAEACLKWAVTGDPVAACRLRLALRRFDAFGRDKATVETVAPYARDSMASVRDGANVFLDGLAGAIKFYGLVVRNRDAEWPVTRDASLQALPVFAEAAFTSPAVSAARQRYVERLAQDAPDVAAVLYCKAGWDAKLGLDPATLAVVLDTVLADPDPDVRKNGLRYLARLPADAAVNDRLYDKWMAAPDDELLAELARQKRVATNEAVNALACLFLGRVDDYVKLETAHAQGHAGGGFLLTEAFGRLKSEAARKRLNQIVLDSRNRVLSQIYAQALGHRDDFDAGFSIDVMKRSKDDAGLLDAIYRGNMTLPEVLDVCEHWAVNGCRIEDPEGAQLAASVLEAYNGARGVKIEEVTAVKPPPDTDDIFEVWEKTKEDAGDKADPFVRAGALYRAVRAGKAAEADLRQAAASEDWPLRLIARLAKPDLAAGKEDHVAFLNGLGDLLPQVLTARASCAPPEHDALNRLFAGLAPTDLNRVLLAVILPLQSRATTKGVWSKGRTADREEAVQLGQVRTDRIDKGVMDQL